MTRFIFKIFICLSVIGVAICFVDLVGCKKITAKTERREAPKQPLVKQEQQLMGTKVEIQAIGPSKPEIDQAIVRAFDEIRKIEDMAHPNREGSDVVLLNQSSGKHPVKVHEEIFEIFKQAREISERSHGAFDITFAAAGKLWNFKDPDAKFPTKKQLAEAVKLIDFRELMLDDEKRTAFLKKQGMQVGLGAIAKGYAADKAMAVLKQDHIKNAIVDAGGDVLLAGSKLGQPWTVGIQHPRKPHGQLYAILRVTKDAAVVTSGDYERFFIRDGILYHHILNPKTGEPARLCQSVTVIGPTGMLSDALATAIFVMGPEKGLEMVETFYPQVDVLIIDAVGGERRTAHFEEHVTILRAS